MKMWCLLYTPHIKLENAQYILLSNRFANVTNASSGSTCRYGTDSYLVGVIKLTAAYDDLAAVTLFVWLNLTENRQSQAADDYASTCTCISKSDANKCLQECIMDGEIFIRPLCALVIHCTRSRLCLRSLRPARRWGRVCSRWPDSPWSRCCSRRWREHRVLARLPVRWLVHPEASCAACWPAASQWHECITLQLVVV